MATTPGNFSDLSKLGDSDGALNKVSSGAHSAVDSVAASASEAASKAKPGIDKAAAVAHQTVDKVATVISEKSESLSAAQKKLVDDTISYISANPLKAVGIGVGIGFLLSRLIAK